MVFLAQLALFGVFFFARNAEQNEDCREQRAALAAAEQSEIDFLNDIVGASTAAGQTSPEAQAIVEDIERRVHQRYAQHPPPSACT